MGIDLDNIADLDVANPNSGSRETVWIKKRDLLKAALPILFEFDNDSLDSRVSTFLHRLENLLNTHDKD